jgi:hypothetical protein
VKQQEQGEKDTLFALQPEKFRIPGQSKNGDLPLPDLEFERDPSVPGLYRAKIENTTLAHENGDGLIIKKWKTDE